MQGKSSDLSRHAIPSIRKHRIILTFGKSNPRRPLPAETSHIPSPAASLQSSWSASSNRPSLPRHSPSALKHYGAIPAAGVLPPPPIRPQHMPPSNAIPPLFVAPAQIPPVAPAPYPTPAQAPPVSAGWPIVAPSMHSGPRLPVPGTGVFLPPSGSNHPQPPHPLPPPSPSNHAGATLDTELQPENPKTMEDKPDNPHGTVTESLGAAKPDCNGSLENGSANQNLNHMKKKTTSKHLVSASKV